jgi:hypothetical protein
VSSGDKLKEITDTKGTPHTLYIGPEKPRIDGQRVRWSRYFYQHQHPTKNIDTFWIDSGCRFKRCIDHLKAHRNLTTGSFGQSKHPLYRLWCRVVFLGRHPARCMAIHGYTFTVGRRWTNQKTGFQTFIVEVDLPPSPACWILPVDLSKPLDKGNYQWIKMEPQLKPEEKEYLGTCLKAKDQLDKLTKHERERIRKIENLYRKAEVTRKDFDWFVAFFTSRVQPKETIMSVPYPIYEDFREPEPELKVPWDELMKRLDEFEKKQQANGQSKAKAI